MNESLSNLGTNLVHLSLRFRYGKHKICICRSKGYNFTVKSKGIQFSLNYNHPCCDKFINTQSSLSLINETAVNCRLVSTTEKKIKRTEKILIEHRTRSVREKERRTLKVHRFHQKSRAKKNWNIYLINYNYSIIFIEMDGISREDDLFVATIFRVV